MVDEIWLIQKQILIETLLGLLLNAQQLSLVWFGTIFVDDIEQNQTIVFLKLKSLNINLFIELMYKIIITFANIIYNN